MLFVQNGHGPATKVTSSFKEGLTDGLILEPRTKPFTTMAKYIKDIQDKYPKKRILFDPQFFASVLKADTYGKLNSYPYFKQLNIASDFTPKKLEQYVKETIDYQCDLGLTEIISPALIMNSFDGREQTINAGMYELSEDMICISGSDLKLYLSFPIYELALQQKEQLMELLNTITSSKAHGFYIFIDRVTNDNLQWADPQRLANVMYIVNVLKDNGYDVIVGYVDIYSILLKAVGASVVANGWHKKQKHFTKARFKESHGGSRTSKYASIQLLNSIFVDDELQGIYEIGLIDDVIMRGATDNKLRSGPTSQTWTLEEEVMHYWTIIKIVMTEIESQASIDGRLNFLKKIITAAMATYELLKANNISFRPESGPQFLSVWQEAITLFEAEVS